MSLRATKSLARNPPGCLNCIKQGIGVEKRVSATYVPMQFNLGDMGYVLGPEIDNVKLAPVLDGVIFAVDRLDGGNLGGQSNCDLNDIFLPVLSPLYACPIGSIPMGHLSCFQNGFGEDKRVSAIYSPVKVMGDRDLLCMGPKHEDCSNIGFQVSSCLDGGVKRGGQFKPTSQSIEVYAAEMKPLVFGSDESLVAGSCDYGTVLSEGLISRGIDEVDVGVDPLFFVDTNTFPESITPPLDS